MGNDAERSRRVSNIREFVYTVYDYYPNSNLPEHVMRRLVCPGPEKHATTPRALAIYLARRRISRGRFTISRDPGVVLLARDIPQIFFNAPGIEFHAALLVIFVFWLYLGYLLVIYCCRLHMMVNPVPAACSHACVHWWLQSGCEDAVVCDSLGKLSCRRSRADA